MIDKTYIGVGHKARHGKDTFARALHALMPRDSKIMSFADALKVYCRVEHGMTTKDAPLLQRIGLEKRAVRENFWVDILKLAAEEASERVIIIPDCRFPNEADFVKRRGHMVKVSRIDKNNVPFVTDDRDPNHPSEIALDGYRGWDYVLRCRNVPEIEMNARSIARQLFPRELANAA